MRDLIAYKNLLAMATLLLLAGCASTPAPVVNHSFGAGQPAPPPAPTAPAPTAKSHAGGVQTFGLGHANGTTTAAGYVVAPGDTLYSVAFAHGMDVRTLAAQNQIPPPYTIHPGQVLQLKATASTPAVAAAPASQAVATKPTEPTEPVFGPVTTQSMTAGGVAATPSAAASTSSVATAPPGLPPAPAVSATGEPPQVAATPPAGATRKVAGIAWRWPAAGKVVGGFSAGAGGDGAGLDIAGEVGDPVRAAASGTVVYSGNGLIGYGELIIVKHDDTYLSAYGHNSKRLVKEGQHVDAGQEIALMGASGAPRVELHFEIRKNGKPVNPADYLPTTK